MYGIIISTLKTNVDTGFVEFILICYLLWYFAAFGNLVSILKMHTLQKTCIYESQTKSQSGEGSWTRSPPLPAEVLPIVSSWEGEGWFSLRVYVVPDKRPCSSRLHIQEYGQHKSPLMREGGEVGWVRKGNLGRTGGR